MLKGCIGFTHIQGSWIWTMLFVRGKHVIRVPLIYPFYLICYTLWKRYGSTSEFEKVILNTKG